MPRPPSPLGVELRWMRDVAGMTARQMGARVGASQPVVSRWETGGRRPTMAQLERWRVVCVDTVENRIATPATAARQAEYLDRLTDPEFAEHLRVLRGPDEVEEYRLPDMVPMDRDWLTDVLLGVWMERKDKRVVASPREHCEAMAAAVLRAASVPADSAPTLAAVV